MEQFFSGVIMGMGVLEFALAVWVLAKDPRSPIHWWFSLFSFSLAVWTFGNGIQPVLWPAFDVTWWDRTLFLGAFFASFCGFQFAQVYPVPTQRKTLNVFSWILLVVLSFMLLFTNLIIGKTIQLDIANLQQLHWVYILGFCFNWATMLFLLFYNRIRVAPQLRQQVNLLLAAFILGSAFGMYASFIAPYLDPPQKISQLLAPGFAFIIFIFSVKVLRIAYRTQ